MLYSVPVSNIQTPISKAVKVLLARTGKSQNWLADQLLVTPSWLSNRISGRVTWDTDDVARLATVFGLDPFEFLRLAETEARIAA